MTDKLYTYLINIQGRPMEVNNSYSENSYQSQNSSTKKVDVYNDGFLEKPEIDKNSKHYLLEINI